MWLHAAPPAKDDPLWPGVNGMCFAALVRSKRDSSLNIVWPEK